MLKIDLKPSTKQLRQFGWIALIGFPVMGTVFTFLLGAPILVLWILAATGVVTCGLAQVNPVLVKPIYLVLMIVSLPIGLALSFTIMVLLYYGMFTSVGVVFRLIGRDPLQKVPDPALPTYWHERAQRPPASYFKLY